MIVFREKIFRRDEISERVLEDLREDEDLVSKYGRPTIRISASKLYNDQLKTFGLALDRSRIKKLLQDIKKGHIVNDGPAGGDTHYLGDYSKLGKYYTFSKAIDDNNRLNYRVYCPSVGINPITKEEEYVKLIVLESCWGHNTREGDYLNDKELRERKDRMRKNAPYRKPESILSEKNTKNYRGRKNRR